MQLINSNAIQKLFENAELLANQPHDSWRCIYLKLRDQGDKSRPELYTSFIKQFLTNLLSSHKGHVYICRDGDIFIVFQGAMKPLVEKLEHHLGGFDSHEISGHAEGSLFRIFEFDLSRNWDNFYKLCERKFLTMLASSDEAHSDVAKNEPRRLMKASAKHSNPPLIPKISHHPAREQSMSQLAMPKQI